MARTSFLKWVTRKLQQNPETSSTYLCFHQNHEEKHMLNICDRHPYVPHMATGSL